MGRREPGWAVIGIPGAHRAVSLLGVQAPLVRGARAPLALGPSAAPPQFEWRARPCGSSLGAGGGGWRRGAWSPAARRAVSRRPGPSLVLRTPHPVAALRPECCWDPEVSAVRPEDLRLFSLERRRKRAPRGSAGTPHGGQGVLQGARTPDCEACHPEGGREGAPRAPQMPPGAAGWRVLDAPGPSEP